MRDALIEKVTMILFSFSGRTDASNWWLHKTCEYFLV